MRSKFLYVVFASVILAGCLAGTLEDTRPTTSIAEQRPSIEKINIEGKNYFIGKIDSTYNQLRIAENTPPPNSKSIKQIHEDTGSVMSFNGSFFSTEFEPLGLLISEGKLIFPAHKSQLMNGVFLITNKGQPKTINYSDFLEEQEILLPEIDFAIQSGPILINQKGQVIADKENNKKAGRTAIGLSKTNEIIVIILRQSLLDRDNSLTLFDFANTLSESKELNELGLHSVVNLDGGNSSGIATNDEYYPELEKVQNIVITIPRDN